MMRPILAAALLALSAPAVAQTAPAATATAPAPAIDPVRLAAATRIVSQVWPLGTYRRMMDGMMDKVMESTIAGMTGMRLGDMAGAGGASPEARRKLGDETLGQTMAKADPAYRERMSITMKVMTDEIVGMMSDIEPQIQTALARAYANRFTQVQLDDLGRFFATPTGTVYARDAMLISSDPEMVQAMQSFVPALMRRMPAIMEKAKAATAHLPPVKTPPAAKAH